MKTLGKLQVVSTGQKQGQEIADVYLNSDFVLPEKLLLFSSALKKSSSFTALVLRTLFPSSLEPVTPWVIKRWTCYYFIVPSNFWILTWDFCISSLPVLIDLACECLYVLCWKWDFKKEMLLWACRQDKLKVLGIHLRKSQNRLEVFLLKINLNKINVIVLLL